MKALVGAFNQEKAEGPSRGLLRDCTISPINRFAALLVTNLVVVILGQIATVSPYFVMT